jgi:hypothetical protein
MLLTIAAKAPINIAWVVTKPAAGVMATDLLLLIQAPIDTVLEFYHKISKPFPAAAATVVP